MRSTGFAQTARASIPLPSDGPASSAVTLTGAADAPRRRACRSTDGGARRLAAQRRQACQPASSAIDQSRRRRRAYSLWVTQSQRSRVGRAARWSTHRALAAFAHRLRRDQFSASPIAGSWRRLADGSSSGERRIEPLAAADATAAPSRRLVGPPAALSPRSRIASSTVVSCGRQVATVVDPDQEQRSRLRRQGLDEAPPGGGSASATSSPARRSVGARRRSPPRDAIRTHQMRDAKSTSASASRRAG